MDIDGDGDVSDAEKKQMANQLAQRKCVRAHTRTHISSVATQRHRRDTPTTSGGHTWDVCVAVGRESGRGHVHHTVHLLHNTSNCAGA
jgi:hypothetical protein